MKKTSLWLWALFLCVFWEASAAFAALDNSGIFFSKFDFAMLSDSSLDVEKLEELYSGDFAPASDGIVRFAGAGGNLWIRFPSQLLKEDLDRISGDRTVLRLSNEHITRADLYLPQRSGVRRMSGGVEVVRSARNFPLPYTVFPIEKDEIQSGKTAYLRLKAEFPLSFALLLENDEALYDFLVGRLTRYMTFLGFLAALLLTYFFFFMMTGDRNYLFTVLTQSVFFLFFVAYSNYLQYYVNMPFRTTYALTWGALGIRGLIVSYYTRRLLEQEAPDVPVRNFSLLQAFGSCAIVVLAFWRNSSPVIFGVIALVVVTQIIFLTFLRKKRIPGSGWFVASRLCFFIGMATLWKNSIAACPMPLLENIFMAAFLLDPILLACMLIPRTRLRLENYVSLEEKSSRYEKMSQRDSITGLYNKAHLLSLLEEQVKLAHSSGKALAFMMLDIDHFKIYNDTWGHLEGDKVVQFLAKIIRQSLRESDFAARYGGEEFSVILPGGILPTSILVAERIRSTFENQSRTLLGEDKKCTISIGLAFLRPGDTIDVLIQRADEALYRAKANGRNRTEFEVDP